MVIDSSAIIAIFSRENGYQNLVSSMLASHELRIAAPTLLETKIFVIRKFGSGATNLVDELLESLEVEVIAFDSELIDIALEAYSRFGKGRHQAALNFGDCFSYALAKSTDDPLLFTGNDFVHTDLRAA